MEMEQALALANRFEEEGVRGVGIGSTAMALRTLAAAYRKEVQAHELTSRYARALELLANSGV